MADTYRPVSAYGHRGPLEGRLSGTGVVADDLWLLAHHEGTGRPYLHARQLGLADELLAELMTGPSPAVQLRHDGLVSIRPQVPQVPLRAAQGHPLLRQMAAEPRLLPVRDWLGFLARTAPGEVGTRPEQAGYATRARRRVPGRPARPVPADRDWAFAPMTRVTAALRRPPGAYGGVVLAGLAVACGLGFRLELYLAGAGPAVQAAVAGLPDELRRLIAQTQTAVSAVQVIVCYDGWWYQHAAEFFACEHGRALSMAGLRDTVRWYAAGLFSCPVQRVMTSHAHYVVGRPENSARYEDELADRGIIGHDVPVTAVKGEAGADAGLALTGCQLACQTSPDIVALLAGDGDFAPLAARLAGRGLRALVPSADVTTSAWLTRRAPDTPALARPAGCRRQPPGLPRVPGPPVPRPGVLTRQPPGTAQRHRDQMAARCRIRLHHR